MIYSDGNNERKIQKAHCNQVLFEGNYTECVSIDGVEGTMIVW